MSNKQREKKHTSDRKLCHQKSNETKKTDRMASKLLSKMVTSKIDGIFKADSDDEKTPPTQKELKVRLSSDELNLCSFKGGG